jgi:manganese transport protein
MVKLIAQSLRRPKNNLLALVRNMGPGFLVAVGFIDPGNIAAGVVAGSTYGYGLLWVVVVGTALVYFLQRRAALVGLGGRVCLSEAIAERVGERTRYGLASLLALAGVATLVAELLGTGIGLHLLTGLPVTLGAGVAAVAAYAVVWRGEYHHIEDIVIGFVALIGGCYLIEVCLARPEWTEVARGALVPTLDGNSLWVALSLLGAIVMPTNLYLHSSLVQERNWTLDDLKTERADTAASMVVGGLINASIIVVAAAVFFRSGREVETLGQAAETLAPLVGGAAKVVFALALVAAGFASTVTGMMASAYGVGGFLHKSQHHHDRPFRFIAAAVTIVAFAVLALDSDALWLMVGSQAALAILLPATVIPLLLLAREARQGARAARNAASGETGSFSSQSG